MGRGPQGVAMPRPVPEVVDLLEEMLAGAKRGEIVAVAVAGLDPAGEWIEDWCAADLGALVFALRGTVIRMRMAAGETN